MPLLTRRSFCGAAASSLALGVSARGDGRYATQHHATEWSYTSGKQYKDPFSEVELDVIFQDAQGKEQRVPKASVDERIVSRKQRTLTFAHAAAMPLTSITGCLKESHEESHIC